MARRKANPEGDEGSEIERLVGRALERIEEDDVEAALKDLERAVSLAADVTGEGGADARAKVHHVRSLAYERQGDLDRALEDCDRSIAFGVEVHPHWRVGL